VIDLQGNDLDSVLIASQHDGHMLTVISAPVTPTLLSFVRRAGTPVLLLQGEQTTPNPLLFSRLLLSLRGHSPDLSALDLVIPLAKANQSALTILAVTGSSPRDWPRYRLHDSLAALLDPQQEPAQHLAECVDRLNEAEIPGYLKLCQGDPVQQIVSEFAGGQYSLLVITSEAYGDFIQQVIEALQTNTEHCAVLVVKPMLPH
jgi:hypothetical protein